MLDEDGCWGRAVALEEQEELNWEIGFLAQDRPQCTILIPQGLKLHGCMTTEIVVWDFFLILQIGVPPASLSRFVSAVTMAQRGINSQSVNSG